ncbi:hypothetical protein EDD86DRAFT_194423 [Gorgonomyces haynaldii]|nr:hypothetical protein EDD86DRAFT_194423 [Gorgonomyces haynaldii]
MASLTPKVEGSFAYQTFLERIPSILGKTVDCLSKDLHLRHESITDEEQDKIKQLISEIGKLRYELCRNRPFPESDWKMDFPEEDRSWFNSTWLFSECFLYHHLQEIVLKILPGYDLFRMQKVESFISHRQALEECATACVRLDLREMILYSLWGNQSDLSLFVHKQENERNHTLVVDHTDALVKKIEEFSGRMIIVLDNAGFELFTDLCLAHVLTKKYGIKIEFQGKEHPWFVSDTTLRDFDYVVAESSMIEASRPLALEWIQWIKDGDWKFQAHPFWTTAHAYTHMPEEAPDLFEKLKNTFAIYKGDLNYRKMVQDRDWPKETRFEDAVGRMEETSFCMLRTLKADTVAGVDRRVFDDLKASDPQWMTNGKHGMIQGVNL